MRKLTVLVDMDDTIEGLAKAWADYLNLRHGTSVSPTELTDWEVWKFFPTLSKEAVYAPLYEDEFWDWVEPLAGASYFLQKLVEDGHKLYIVTASNYQSLRAKMKKVLFRYFPFLKWEDVIVTYHKQLINGDVLVDDGLHNLVGGKYHKLLMSCPHNLSFDTAGTDIIRVDNWAEAYQEITNIAKAE